MAFRKSNKRRVTLAVTVLIIAVTGSILLVISRAATPFVSGEPETGAIGRGVIAPADTTASGGKAVQFTGPLPTPAPTPVRPGPSNTGVPDSRALKVHEGDLKITVPNTIVDSMEIRGTVWIQTSGVVIKNTLITGRVLNSDLALVMVDNPAYSVTIQDSELYARHPTPHVRGIIGMNLTLIRTDIHNVIGQMVITGSNVLVRDSWLHGNLYYLQDPNYNGTPSHDDNAQISIGNNLKFINNTMESTRNAAIMVTQDRGKVSNLTLSGNYISHGACAVNLAEKTFGPMQGFIISNNIFTRNQTFAGCAMVVDRATIPLLLTNGNTWSDGAPVTITAR